MADSSIIPGDPFSLQIAPHTRLARAAVVAARPFLRRLLHLSTFRDLYRRAQTAPGETFEARVLRTFAIRFRVHAAEGARIPFTGPVIVAANHPTGARDGLVLIEAVRQIRPDVRLLTNHLLAAIPELRESCFFVDPFGGPSAAIRSLEGLRSAHLWLRGGGALIVFPAGEVAWRAPASVASASRRTRADSPWLPTVGRLALGSRARVLPVFIDGQNSWAFYVAGRLHPLLRTLLLGRELLRQRETAARIYLGKALADDDIRGLRTPDAVTEKVRNAVDALARQSDATERAGEIEPSIDPALLAHDVRALGAKAKLLTSGVYDVFCTGADSIPHVLREIGRLREVTFRAVGEGTGGSIDLDRFDTHYEHLFVWNRETREVVGAYRVGATDRIVPAHGLGGLYTTTLFRYDERLLRRLSPALELGRSFVRPEYQRSHSALLLLWKGIGRLVARAPEYRVLFGPVSISSRYQDTTQQMLRAFLAQNHGDAELGELVEAVNPPSPIAPPPRNAAQVTDVDELDALITKLEGHQGIPVLLRHYLRLNATLLGFNLDPAFGDALDALLMVDLTRLPAGILQRYLGREQAKTFLTRHGVPSDRSQAAA